MNEKLNMSNASVGIFRLWILLSSISVSVFFSVGVVQAETSKSKASTDEKGMVLTLVADQWCPYNCVPGSDTPGYMIELAQKVFEPMGYSIDYQNVNWSRAILAARKGKYSAIIGAYKDDAPDFIFPDKALANTKNCFMTRSDSTWNFEGVVSLRSVNLGVVNDYTYGDVVDSYVAAFPDNVNTDPSLNGKWSSLVQVVGGETPLMFNFQKLTHGRIDTLIDDLAVLNYYIKQHTKDIPPGSVREAGCLDGTLGYIAFSPALPDSAKLAKALSNGMGELRKAGELAKILSKYGMKDWE